MQMFVLGPDPEEFEIGTDSFVDLEIRPTAGSSLYYFYDKAKSRLVKFFVLRKGPQVTTLCQVTLVKVDDKFSPRLRLMKRKNGTEDVETVGGAAELVAQVKAAVSLGDCHAEFWQLVGFIGDLAEIDLPEGVLAVASKEAANLGTALEAHSKEEVLEAVRVQLEGTLTEADIALLTSRRKKLAVFEKLLTDTAYFDERIVKFGGGPEKVWQVFLERNPWILGYGLLLISCEAYSPEGLEQRTTGNNVFTGAGKRADALMRTRAFVRSLLFVEFKHHRTELLKSTPYRPPDVYAPSGELVGGVAQVQKTAEKALLKADHLWRAHQADGEAGEIFSTVRPRQVLLIGHQQEFESGDTVNVEKMSSFEMYRRSIGDVEVITFDELYQRATFIVGD
jgi:hypothetical protein